MEQQHDERYLKQLGRMERPIPGQSLTNDPNNPMPFERPPQFTKKKDAVEEIFGSMINPEVYESLIGTIAKGTPIMELTQVLLYEGFREGKWNPDMLLMLVEPTAYMAMALAERAGVEYVVDRDVEPEGEGDKSKLEKKLEGIKRGLNTGNPKKELPKKIEKQIDELPVESLISKPEAAPVEDVEPEVNESLIPQRAE